MLLLLIYKKYIQREVNLTKYGSKKAYLIYKRRTNKKDKPITSIALIQTNKGEEPPLGFEIIKESITKRDANLSSNKKRSLYLCIYRGDGPPITDITIMKGILYI